MWFSCATKLVEKNRTAKFKTKKSFSDKKKIKQALNYNKLEEYLECLYYYINNINNIIIMGSALWY